MTTHVWGGPLIRPPAAADVVKRAVIYIFIEAGVVHREEATESDHHSPSAVRSLTVSTELVVSAVPQREACPRGQISRKPAVNYAAITKPRMDSGSTSCFQTTFPQGLRI